MASSRRKFQIKHPVIVDIGCSCRRLKLSSFLFSSSRNQSRPPHRFHTNFSPSTSASLTTTTVTHTNSTLSPSATASSPSPKQSMKKKTIMERKKKRNGGVAEESVAIEKDSCDPYFDFRDSMLQMIIEKEIYSWDELRELLHLFLSLNPPCNHPIIHQAFAGILSGVFSPGA